MSVPDDAVSPVPNDAVSPVPDDVVILRPFTVRRLDNHVTVRILQTLSGLLLFLTVLNIFFCLIAGDADEKKSDAATADGWAFLLGNCLSLDPWTDLDVDLEFRKLIFLWWRA